MSGLSRLDRARYLREPQALTFELWHEITATWKPEPRTSAFWELPSEMREEMWANLAEAAAARSDEDWRIERDDEHPEPEHVTHTRTVSEISNTMPTTRNDDDDLTGIPPAIYIEELLGVEVPSDGKIVCPFHDDRTPSLHIYDHPDRGWFCFGCGRGGSIFDFAAELAGINPRGVEFVGLADYLRKRFT